MAIYDRMHWQRDCDTYLIDIQERTDKDPTSVAENEKRLFDFPLIFERFCFRKKSIIFTLNVIYQNSLWQSAVPNLQSRAQRDTEPNFQYEYAFMVQ